MRRNRVWLLGLLALVCCASGCKENPSMAKEEESTHTDRTEVEVAPPEVADVPEVVSFSATVVIPDVLGVAARLPGTISQVLVDEGDVVKKGQVLLRLDEADLVLQVEQAEKAVASAEVRLEQLRLSADIERQSLELGVKQAEAALAQVHAKAKMVEEGARPEEKRQVAAVVEMARTQMEAMARETDRMKGLYEEKVIPKQRLEELEDGYKVAQAQFRQASAQLRLVKLGARDEDREAMAAAVDQVEHAVELARVSLKQIEARKLDIKATELAIEQARTGLAMARLAASRADVVAPAAGVVDAIAAREGMVTGAGIPLVTLTVIEGLEVRAILQQEKVWKVRPGMAVSYVVDGLQEAEPLSGKVVHVGTLADVRTGGFPVTVGVAPEDTVGLKGGMHVHGTIAVGVHSRALLVPTRSVLRREGSKVVFTVEEGLAHMVKVKTGAQVGQALEVLSGLDAESQVVHRGHLGLVDGVAVRIADSTPSNPDGAK